jgi:hypothetical protein
VTRLLGQPTASEPASARRDPARLLPLLFPLLALILLRDVLLGGQVLLPAAFLKAFAPWSATAEGALPQWNILQWDGMAEFYPWRLFAARELAAGRIPLWNPNVLCGTPFLANSQSAPLYPLHALLYLPLGVSTAVRMAWIDFLHLSLAGLFVFLLAREMGARPLAAAVAGTAFELSGFAVAWLELPSFLGVACWIPLAMLCVGRAVRLGSWRWAAGTGAAVGLMLLAGHLQIAFYGLIAAGLMWLWEAAAGHRLGTARLARSIALGTAALALGLALAAPQLLPAVELSRISHRTGPPTSSGYGAYVRLAMPVQNLVTLLVPDYYGLPGRGDFWGSWGYGAPNVMEYAGHVGAAGFLLAVVGLVTGRKRRGRTALLAVIGTLSLLLACGTPLSRIVYFYVPGFAQSGSPARALVLFCLAQALLAGLGLEALLAAVERRWTEPLKLLALGAGVTLALMGGLHLAAQGAVHDMPSVTQQALVRGVAYAAIAGFLLALLAWLFRENTAEPRIRALGYGALVMVAGGLLLLDDRYNLTAAPALAYPATPLTDALVRAPGRVVTLNREWSTQQAAPALLPPNASLAYGWRDAQGYDSLYLGRYRALANEATGAARDASPPANGNIVFIQDVSSPLLSLLAGRYVVSQEPLSRAGLSLAPGFPAGPPYVYEDGHAVPEAYLATSWFAARDGDGFRSLCGLPPGGLARVAFVDANARSGVLPSPEPGLATVRNASLERVAPGRLVARAAPARRSLLVLVEGYTPGWKATVRRPGRAPVAAKVLRVNGAFQAVVLEPGEATVEWRYEPGSFRTGLFLALAALAVLAATGLTTESRRHGETEGDAERGSRR